MVSPVMPNAIPQHITGNVGWHLMGLLPTEFPGQKGDLEGKSPQPWCPMQKHSSLY